MTSTFNPAKIQDRIKELRRVPAGSLIPSPKNWRRHPPAQQAAMQHVLARLGYVDALLAREAADGTLHLMDGHLRASLTPETLVPVLIVDVSAEEADLVLATLDPLAALAETDHGQLDQLLADFKQQGESLGELVRHWVQEQPTPQQLTRQFKRESTLPQVFQVVVDCLDEADQRLFYDRMTEEGRTCRVLTLC